MTKSKPFLPCWSLALAATAWHWLYREIRHDHTFDVGG
jgi:hypothetical protein